MKKRILVLTSTFPRWKNDTTPPFVYELERRLTKDFEIHVLAPNYQGAKKEEMMGGLHVHRFQYFWPAKLQKLCYEGGILSSLKYNKFLYIQAVTLMFFELKTTIKLCRKYNFDLIHAHWIISQGIVAYIINKLLKISYIVTSHGSDLHSIGLNHIKKIILCKAKKIIVVSNYLKEQIKSLDPSFLSKTEVLPMGVDSKLFNTNKYDQSIKERYDITGPFLLFVGRLSTEKGIKYLIAAMPRVLKKHPKAKLLIIGGGTLKGRLRNLVKTLKIQTSVVFVGLIEHKKLPPYFASADIFVSPSIKEGFGLTLVEAGMSGCSLIAINFGGMKDIVQNNENGILLNSSNPKLISKAIIQLINDPRLFDKKNIRKEFIKKFGYKNIISKHARIINKL